MRLHLPIAALVLAAAPLAAQSINIDFQPPGSPPGAPPSTYGAALGSPGVWNPVSTPAAAGFLATNGAPTPVAMNETSCCGIYFITHDFPTTTGDDAALLDDQYRPEDLLGTWNFSGLVPGDYAVATIIAAFGIVLPLQVSVPGANEGTQNVNGIWNGTYVQGLNYALHTKTVTDGTLVVNVFVPKLHDYAQISGIQLVKLDDLGSSFCAGDGVDPQVTTACPCANTGAPGHGCANSVEANGALLAAGGTTTPDTAVLHGSGMPNTSTALYLKSDGTNTVGVVLGDGLRCIDGQILRLRTQINVGGVSQYPEPGQLALSVRGQTPPGSGLTAYYQVYYRNANPTFCTSETFNLTNGVVVVW